MMTSLTLTCAIAIIAGGVTLSLDTPLYRVIDKHNKMYEVRTYPSTMWVSTTDEDPENVKAMFLRLFYYMQGANSEGRTLEMTVPMLRHHHEDGNVTLMLYLSSDLYKKYPEPTDSAVNVTVLPTETYAVWQFGGFATNEIWEEQLQKFKETIAESGNITMNEYFAASYSGFYDIIDRRNELWFIHKSEDQS